MRHLSKNIVINYSYRCYHKVLWISLDTGHSLENASDIVPHPHMTGRGTEKCVWQNTSNKVIHELKGCVPIFLLVCFVNLNESTC